MFIKKTLVAFLTIAGLLTFLPTVPARAASDETLSEFLLKIDAIEQDSDFLPDQNIIKKDLIEWTLKSLAIQPDTVQINPCKEDLTTEEQSYFETAIRIRSINYHPIEKFCKPENVMSRIEIVRHVLTVYGIPVPQFINNELSVKDVAKNSWVAPWINRVLELNLLAPLTDNNFRPFGKSTRREATELIYNTSEYLKSTNQPTPQKIEIIIEPGQGTAQIPHNDILFDVWQQIVKNYIYYDQNVGLTPDDFAYEAIQGLVKATKDKYASFTKPDEDMIIINEDSFGGIGAVLDENENSEIEIINVLPGNPAEKAGLRSGDVIKKVDQKVIENFSADELARLIRGEEGTNVKISVKRGKETLEFEITRAIIEIRTVSTEELEKKIIKINIGQFEENIDQVFDETLASLKEKNYTGYIIDLRNNPGGFVDATTKILGHFIPAGKTLVYLQKKDGSTLKESSPGPADLAGIPLVVLVNEGSASAAEIFAAALQDHKLATIIGTTTYGKGTAQELSRYDSGESFKITVAEWLSPNKNRLNGVGVTPDIIIENSDTSKDLQLEKALEEIKKKIK